MVNSKSCHLIHCFVLLVCLTLPLLFMSPSGSSDPWTEYGKVWTCFLYATNLPVILALPLLITTILGLIIYDAFPGKIHLKGSPMLAPFICFRVVTRGDYPNLVNENVVKNLKMCHDVGLEHFIIEVVTDKLINIPKSSRTREIIVPDDYETNTHARFKARALQYCLEDEVNVLSPYSWIVHLDEETLLSDNSIRGIVNFVLEGRHTFGQGLITYANENVVNWLTTLIDSTRVADDMGKVQFQFRAFNRPVFGLKGSFVVVQLEAERDISFDNGYEGSVTEDAFFALRGWAKGYSFGWIEGEMHEKSPFTFMDVVRQRKRWLEGLLLTVRSKRIPCRCKIFLIITTFSTCTNPLTIAKLVLTFFYPIENSFVAKTSAVFTGFVIYSAMYGMIKSLSFYRSGFLKSAACVIGSVLVLPLFIVAYSIAVVMMFFTFDRQFYIVKK